ncbi:MAG: precorrin-2 C(20)-methyltransferase [Cyanobacteria bacterium J06641_5]
MGIFWGIGVGPGDPEWLTIKGLRVLRAAAIVALPQNKQGHPGMAYEIVREFLLPEQKIVPLALPFVRDAEILQAAWQAAARELLPALRQGKDIVFLSEGDISFYSTFTYVARALQEIEPNLTIRSVPGVCSPLAAASVLGEPLAIAGEKVAILPALYHPEELSTALAWAEVVVLMKVASIYKPVWQYLAEQNLLDRTSLVAWVGGEKQTILSNLVDAADYKPHYFSLLIIRNHERA